MERLVAVRDGVRGGPVAYAARPGRGATHLWRLGEPSGPGSSTRPAICRGHRTDGTLAAAGALTDDPDTAVTISGGQHRSPRRLRQRPLTHPAVTVEAWVKTTSTRGGRIVGFGDSATGTARPATPTGCSISTTPGRANFAINDGAYRTIYSRTGINDGQWHQVVGAVGADGMQLYVDGCG